MTADRQRGFVIIMSHRKEIASHESNVVSLDEHRPHNASYVACMDCGHDWPCVHPPEVVDFECPNCGHMTGEIVAPGDAEWFKRFMDTDDKEQQQRRTMILLNAQRMIDGGTFD